MHALPALLILATLASPPSAPLALRGLDPVHLAEGAEHPGDPGLERTRGRFRYRFASEETRARFEAEPDRYAVQLGGACPRMGPLAGAGEPDRWLVHEGRIYLFASEACRRRFAGEPARFIDRADPPVAPSPGATAAAAAVLERAVAAMGGDGLRTATGYDVVTRATYRQGERTAVSQRRLHVEFPDTGVADEAWPEGRWGWRVGVTGGWFTKDGRDQEPAEPGVREHMARLLLREPPVLLRAWLAGRAAAEPAGAGEVGGEPTDAVRLSAEGATTELHVSRRDGRVLRASYLGRGPMGIGRVEVTYAGHAPAGPLLLPRSAAVTVDGAPVGSPALEILSASATGP